MLHSLKEHFENLWGVGGPTGASSWGQRGFAPLIAQGLAPAMAQRLTLLLNHVLLSEPVATQRLLPHTGCTLQLELESWPALLPAPPLLAWRVSAAGLLEWVGAEAVLPHADLSLRLDASNPAALLATAASGGMPSVQVEGDAQFAGDVNWLMQNLRWDIAADLERLFGPALAQPLHQLGAAVANAVRSAVMSASDLRRGWPRRDS